MNQQGEQLTERLMCFALAAAQICRAMTGSWEGRHVAGQLFRSATSAAANHRAARRARSRREFAAKLGTVLEEADESKFWLEFATRSRLCNATAVASQLQEAGELTAIFTAATRTANQAVRDEKRRSRATA
jgi:four helix bundle protein